MLGDWYATTNFDIYLVNIFSVDEYQQQETT